jgi:hypothetical protein
MWKGGDLEGGGGCLMGLSVDIVGGLGGGAGQTGKGAPDLTLYRLLRIPYDTSFKQIEESAKRVIIFPHRINTVF